jgi:predicted RNA-binding protein with TRAM domain
MARANITVTPTPGIGAGVEAVYVAGNQAQGMKLLNQVGSRVILIVKNAQAGATVTVTIKAVAGTSASDIVTIIPLATTATFGPFPASLYTQPSGTYLGYVDIDLSTDTSVTLAAVSF